MRFAVILLCLCAPLVTLTQVFPHLEWQRFYGKSGEDIPTALGLAADNRLLLGGATITHRPDEAPDQNGWIIKVDTTGYELWEREIRLPGRQIITDLQGTEDGGVIFCGISAHVTEHPEPASPEFRSDVMIGRLNALGEVMWVRHYGGSGQDRALALSPGVYNEWLVVGGAHSPGGVGDVKQNLGRSDLWMVKVDEQGEKRLTKTLGDIRSDWANAAITCADGDFMVAGYTNSPRLDNGPVSSYGNGWVVRLDPQGNVRWSRVFYCPRGGYFTDLKELEDKRIALVGQRANEQGLEQGWLMKLTPDGARVQEEIFENAGFHSLESLTECSGGGLLLSGYSRGDTGPQAKGRTDLWVYRLDSQGNIVWRNTYGGPNDERGVDVIEARPGLFYVLGQKVNDFGPEQTSKGKDFWLLRIREYSCKYLQASVSVRAKNYKVPRGLRVRFMADHTFATAFSWDFGDGTTSDEQNPLKSYRLPGMYQPRLTVYANEGCWRTVKLPRQLVVE